MTVWAQLSSGHRIIGAQRGKHRTNKNWHLSEQLLFAF
jgi:hypothetical protein